MVFLQFSPGNLCLYSHKIIGEIIHPLPFTTNVLAEKGCLTIETLFSLPNLCLYTGKIIGQLINTFPLIKNIVAEFRQLFVKSRLDYT